MLFRSWAVADDPVFLSLKHQFHKNNPNDQIFEKLHKEFDLSAPAFNAGVMAFSTNIIKEDSFDTLCKLFQTYHKISTYADQPINNLYFSKSWKKLNYSYNLFIPMWDQKYGIRAEKIDAIILHFCGHQKPWLPESYFYKEWKIGRASCRERVLRLV